MKKVLKQLALVYIVIYGLLFLFFFIGVLPFQSLYSSFPSGIINLMNSLAAIYAFHIGFNKSNNKFLIYTMGGMVTRLLLMLLLIFISLKFLNIDKLGFIFTLVIIYFINLILEINYFRLKIAEKKKLNYVR